MAAVSGAAGVWGNVTQICDGGAVAELSQGVEVPHVFQPAAGRSCVANFTQEPSCYKRGLYHNPFRRVGLLARGI